MRNTTKTADETFIAEDAGIEPASESVRFGKPSNQFTIRFAPVIYLAPIFLGAVGIPLGLGLFGTLSAIIVANILAAIGAGLCATMGPRFGMPQLAMGRSVFGYRGNYLPSIFASILFIGYFGIGTAVGGQSLQDLLKLPYIPMAILIGILSIALAMYGYKLLHFFGTWVTRISIVVLLAVTLLALQHDAGTSGQTVLSGSKYWLVWALQFSIVFSFSVSWSLYASDYSRYLPSATSSAKIFSWAASGLFVGSTWMMGLGALLASITPEGNVMGGFNSILNPTILTVVLLSFAAASITHNAVNLYSCAMTCLAWDLPLKRSATVVLCGLIGTAFAIIFGGSHFQDHFNSFLMVMSYFILPWLAIRLMDHFWKHRSDAAPIDQFCKKDGAFKGVRWPGMSAFLVAIAASVPFMVTDVYVGPAAEALGGADVSYVISFVVAAILYGILEKSYYVTTRTYIPKGEPVL